MRVRHVRRLCIVLPLALLLVACGYSDPYAKASKPQATVAATTATPTPTTGGFAFSMGASKKPVKFPDGLQYVDIKVGSGTRATAGMGANIDYTLYLGNGTRLQSSTDPGASAITTTLDPTQLIPGFVQGVEGMRVGGIRRILVPPSLGYTNAQSRPSQIPANATLVFIVRLNSVTAATPTPSASPT